MYWIRFKQVNSVFWVQWKFSSRIEAKTVLQELYDNKYGNNLEIITNIDN